MKVTSEESQTETLLEFLHLRQPRIFHIFIASILLNFLAEVQFKESDIRRRAVPTNW